MYVLKKELFNSLVAKEGTVKMVNGSTCEVIGTWTVKVRKRWDGECSGGGTVCPGDTVQSNIHKGSTKKDAGSKCDKASSQLAKETG